MEDTTSVTALRISSRNDTVSFTVEKTVVLNNLIYAKSHEEWFKSDAVIPVIAALLTLALTRCFDAWTEKRKVKSEIFKENRESKAKYLRELNSLKMIFKHPRIPDPDHDDFKEWIADSLLGTNPFESLQNDGNILFGHDPTIVDLIDKLYTGADFISQDFDGTNRSHSAEALDEADSILSNLPLLIDKIRLDLKRT